MKIKGLRWWVIALVTVINYIDRQALPLLWPDIAEELYSNKTADQHKGIYAVISIIFIFSYAFGLTALVPWLTSGGNYTPAFIIGGVLTVLTIGSVWILIPKIEPLKSNN